VICLKWERIAFSIPLLGEIAYFVFVDADDKLTGPEKPLSCVFWPELISSLAGWAYGTDVDSLSLVIFSC
jgi:hypothetical protein